MNPTPTPARVLVVDDEAMARESLCALLARENYQVWETGQGDKVESMVREQLLTWFCWTCACPVRMAFRF